MRREERAPYGVEHDQARTLRGMVSPPGARRRGSTAFAPPPAPAGGGARASSGAAPWVVPHKLIFVVGGSPGVGATSVARNLAAGAAARGIRALHCEPSVGLPLVRAGSADYFVLDPGRSLVAEGLADYLVLVTSPEDEAVKGAYLALKKHRRSEPALDAGLIVNRVRLHEEGAELAERFTAAARAFVGGPELEVLGWIVADREAAEAEAEGRPFVTERPCSAAASGVRLCVRRLWSRVSCRAWSSAAA